MPRIDRFIVVVKASEGPDSVGFYVFVQDQNSMMILLIYASNIFTLVVLAFVNLNRTYFVNYEQAVRWN